MVSPIGFSPSFDRPPKSCSTRLPRALRSLTLVGLCLFLAPACDEDPTGLAFDLAQGTDLRFEAGTGDGKPGDGQTIKDGLSIKDGKSGSDGLTTKDGGTADAFNPNNHPACNGTIYACADGKDNDGDKLIDALDPECTGPCDNDEGSFEIGIPGANVDPCKQDCYWDANSGRGDDKCEWTHKCDPLGPGTNLKPSCPYDANYTKCPTTQDATCLSFCLPLVPNGCDCFGCCVIYVGGKPYGKAIYLGSGTGCSVKTPQNCAACTQFTKCLNSCGECELCLGKKITDLPAKCFPGKQDAGVPITDGGTKPGDGGTKPGDGGTKPGDGGPLMPACPPNVQSCLTNSNCPTEHYCITGCCIRTIQ